ncbi:hypothetical protein GV828_01770 [Flavobacterium sp. NST-5]|uniref:DUF5723 domain-containing protein n=1 Tax=Flavobacterium ichthyis TaxID=2698827 RepID=A0ABW9Z5T1_9FLAO|nr:hypothetical protein [Flavobacterium ichthyis]NBL63922.1 hypothetical protein [Flavobacterium ichthyis]
MKTIISIAIFCVTTGVLAQDHFSGIATSRRGGLLNASYNPAELANLQTDYEVAIIATSVNFSNNRLGYSDLLSDNFEDKIFATDKKVNLLLDTELMGPGFAIKIQDWAFSFQSKAYAKINFSEVNPYLGDALTNENYLSLLNSVVISDGDNQRANGTVWGELAFGISKIIFEDDTHKFNAGVSMKLLFPGSYANFGARNFNGTIDIVAGNPELTNATANLNIAYSGGLAEDFTEFNNYSSALFGNLNGFAADFGLNYQLKDDQQYKLNAGVSLRNIGKMSFKDSNNHATNYTLNIPSGESLNLNQFQNVSNFEDVEEILLQSGYLTETPLSRDFRVNLPSLFSAYADLKIVSDFYVTVFGQQKLNEDDGNDQITTQNVLSITPRYATEKFEVFAPIASNEISGFTAGLGMHVGGFFVGSGSVLTALLADGQQADFYIGFRLGFN